MAIRMSRWQRVRTSVFLATAGVIRRLTMGTRAVLIDGDKVLLVRHTYVPGWHFPGGGVEPGESAGASLERELREETGYRLTGPATLFGLYYNAGTSRRDHVVLYICRDFEKAHEFVANLEIAEIGWFGVHALPDDVGPACARRIAEVFDGAAIEATW